MDETIHTDISARFANMSIVCAFLVVCIHVGGVFENGSIGWWFSELTRDGIARVAVPYFFLASGFFLAGKFAGVPLRGMLPVWRNEVLKRVRSLLVPLVIWPIIWMLWNAPFIMVANKIAVRPLTHAVPFLNGVLWPGFGILWFVRFLFILVLLSPLLLFLIRKCGYAWLVVAFAAYWSAYTFLDLWKPMGPFAWCVYVVSLEGIAYFSLGLLLRCNVSVILALRGIMAYGILSLGILFMVLSVICKFLQITVSEACGSGYLNLRHFPVPFLMAGIFGLMPPRRFPYYLISAAFPVYLLHCVWVLPIRCVLNQIRFVPAVARYLIVWLGAFGLSVFTAWLMRKRTPKVADVLFGGR